MIEGRISDFAQYTVGIAEGLKQAIIEIDRVYKQLDREDE